MTNPILDWRPRGSVSLWTFRKPNRNYAGWHATADRPGCEAIVDLCDRLRQATTRVSRSITLTIYLHFPFCGIGGPVRPGDFDYVQTLRLTTDPDFAPTHWRLARDADTLLFEAGVEILAELQEGFSAILRDEGDYCIGPGKRASKRHRGRADDRLWFWWYVSVSDNAAN